MALSNSGLCSVWVSSYLPVDFLRKWLEKKEETQKWRPQEMLLMLIKMLVSKYLGFYIYLFFWLYWQSSWRVWTGSRVRDGEWHAAKGPGPGVEPGSAAEPSAHGSRALPTELCGAPIYLFLNQAYTMLGKDHNDYATIESKLRTNFYFSIWQQKIIAASICRSTICHHICCHNQHLL